MGLTIKDIANEAGVSVTTVSRVINNKPDVSDDTRNRVKEVINRLGYNPNKIARGLVLQKTYTIGLIIPDISNPFFPEVVKGVEDRSRERNYSVIFCNTDNKKEEERKAIELLKSKQVDGIILSLSLGNKEILDKLEDEEFPVVQIDRKISSSLFPAVIIDNVLSAYQATQYLIKRGHRDIAHITGDLDTITGRNRLKGFNKACNEMGYKIREEWIVRGDYSMESGYRAMMVLLNQPQSPTAVFAANDLMALGAYEAVYEKGLEIPGDVSIIGHDDIDIAGIIRPGLTTMSQPKYEMGQRAADVLINEIEGTMNTGDIILDMKLVERSSVKELKD